MPVAQPSTLDGSITAAAGKISPSVVTITVRSGQGGGIGSGVVLDSEGHILTNEHVVSEASTGTSNTGTGGNGTAEITVTFEDGSTASATVVGTSPKNDLAVIKVSGVGAATQAGHVRRVLLGDRRPVGGCRRRPARTE